MVQSYNRDIFLFLYFLLIIVSAITSFKVHNDKSPITGKSILYLNRHQTEEWKGWMQVNLLWFDFEFSDICGVCFFVPGENISVAMPLYICTIG